MYATRQLQNKLKQYKKARTNAKLSAPDLANSLDMARIAFEGSSRKANFVSHSLGNYVLENSHNHKSLRESLSYFDSILLHQGDADDKNHRLWIDAIEKNSSVVVTTNEKDKILEISNIYNHKSMKNKRLGNVSKATKPDSPIYQDFTGTKNIGFTGHTIFLTPLEKNSDVFLFFKPIIG